MGSKVTLGGVWLGVDPGKVRIGVAASDPDRVLAVPVETVQRGRADIERIVAIASERGAVQIFVGLPRTLSGAERAAAQDARTFARALAAATKIPVRLLDERLTTVTASRDLRSAGRSVRSSRSVIDQAAATVLLQSALDTTRESRETVGELVLVVDEPTR